MNRLPQFEGPGVEFIDGNERTMSELVEGRSSISSIGRHAGGGKAFADKGVISNLDELDSLRAGGLPYARQTAYEV